MYLGLGMCVYVCSMYTFPILLLLIGLLLLSYQWAVEAMGCRINGLSDQWAVGPVGCRTKGPRPYILPCKFFFVHWGQNSTYPHPFEHL